MGIMANKLFFGYPTSLAAISIFLLSLIVLSNKNFLEYNAEIISLLLILMSTLRLKAIGACFLIAIMTFYIMKSKRKISLSIIIIISLICLLVGWNQIKFYYLDTSVGSARHLLTVKSVEIAKDHFPLGAGFGTFGSYASGVNYSPLYYDYNLYVYNGLTPENHKFISDTYWPMILGQFGFIGLICFLIIIYCIFAKIQDNYYNKLDNIYIAKLICFVYLIISSTSESAFSNPIAIPLAIILGLRYVNSKNDEYILLGGKK